MSSSASDSERDDEPITKARIRDAIDEILPTVDLATTGFKKFCKLLSKKCFGGADLKEFKSFIKKALTEAINNQESEEEESEEENQESEEEESEEEDVARVKKRKGVNKGGYNAPKGLSPKLSEFLGTDELSRPQIVKALWAYIKEKDLQNPENRKEILLDAKMQEVFDCDKFTMFSMNKYISHHTAPFPPLDLTSKPKPSSKKRAASKSSSGTAKKRKAGTQPPYRLSEALINVLKKDVLPRPQVVSGLWDYIKANDLQNPNDKREIICDEKLKKIFEGKKKVTMFSMNKFITPHLIEKVDQSEYNHEASDSD